MELGGERRGCGQKSANVHAKNVSKIFLLEVTLFASIIFCLWSLIILARVKSMGGCPFVIVKR